MIINMNIFSIQYTIRSIGIWNRKAYFVCEGCDQYEAVLTFNHKGEFSV